MAAVAKAALACAKLTALRSFDRCMTRRCPWSAPREPMRAWRRHCADVPFGCGAATALTRAGQTVLVMLMPRPRPRPMRMRMRMPPARGQNQALKPGRSHQLDSQVCEWARVRVQVRVKVSSGGAAKHTSNASANVNEKNSEEESNQGRR